MEAMSTGIPCVVSDIPNFKDLIEDGMDGYVCPLGEKQTFISRILSILNSKLIQNKLSQNSRNKIKNHYSVRKRVFSTLELYES